MTVIQQSPFKVGVGKDNMKMVNVNNLWKELSQERKNLREGNRTLKSEHETTFIKGFSAAMEIVKSYKDSV